MARFKRILSIDGGGIRGIIAGQILAAMERKLQAATGRPGARLAEFFDLVAGTSTGGILACLYLCPRTDRPRAPRFSAAEAVALYTDHGAEVFDLSVWRRIVTAGGLNDETYSAAGLEKLLADTFGNLALRDLVKPCLIPGYDIERRKAHFFTAHDARRRPEKDFLVRDAARASAAAPTIFEPVKVKSLTGTEHALIDGGVFANNPALCAYAEARCFRGKPTAADMVIFSVGTGAKLRPYPFDRAKDWGKVGWLGPVLDIIMSGVAETVDYELRKLFEAVRASRQYIRVDPDLGGASPDLDDARPENIAALKAAGDKAAEDHAAELDRVVELVTAR